MPSIEDGLRLYEQLGTEYGLAYAQTSFANLLRQKHDPPAAIEHYRHAIASQPSWATSGEWPSAWKA